MRECLNADEILGLLGEGPEGDRQNELPSELQDELHAHLAECPDCAALLVASSRTSAELASSLASGQAQAGIRIGRYQIEGLVGCGGHGAVYRCLDPMLGRTVALKVQRVDPEQSSGVAARQRARLLEEARSMARFHHPNVVPVFDADTFEGQVYLVMELIEGGTLRRHVRERKPDWREIVRLFVTAGRGLAAAHAAGLVHRDFKPENVLVGRNGDVKVVDFGLALEAGSAETLPPVRDALSPAELAPAAAPRERRTVSGTQGYIAPERLAGRTSDARGDQFGFCVALYEALYGVLPYPEQVTLSSTFPIAEPAVARRVPARLRRVLLRGLSIAPENRYPTLGELLDELEQIRGRGWQRPATLAAGAALAMAAAGGLSLVVLRQQAADPCHAPQGRLAGVWDDAVRSKVRSAFTATGSPDAADVATYAEKAMDRAGSAWIAAYRDACEATRVRHAQPESALELRLDCLDEQRLDLRAAAELMANPDAKDLPAAIGAATTLPLPSKCANAQTLSTIQQPDPDLRPRVAELRLELARGRALRGEGRYGKAVEVLKPLPDQAAAIGARPLQAAALYELAVDHGSLQDFRSAIDLGTRAESLAVAVHLDELATQAAAVVATRELALGSPRPQVDAALERTREDLRHAGADGTAELFAEIALGYAASARGQVADAAGHDRRALTLARALYGNDATETVWAIDGLSADLRALGQYDESLSLLQASVQGLDSVFGPRNQRAIVPQLFLVDQLLHLGRIGEAQAELDLLFARLAAEPARIERALALAARADLQGMRGQRAESLESARLALDLARRLDLLTSPNWPDLHELVAEAYLRDGRPQQAVDEFETYLSRLGLESDSPNWLAYLRLGGWAYLDTGRPQQALPLLERALALSAAHPCYPGWVGRLRYQLAKVLVLERGDRRRAELLARAAVDELQRVPSAAGLLAEVAAWRARTFPARP